MVEWKCRGITLSKCDLISLISESASNSEFFSTELEEAINPVLQQQLNTISSFKSS